MVEKIAILGANGYIARNLLKHLEMEECSILCIQKNEPKERNERLQYATCDVLETERLAEILNGSSLVINLAAIVKTKRKKEYQKNIEIAKSIVAAMKSANIKKVLHFSTQNIYLQKKGPYAKSKEASEKIIKESGLSYMILRPNYVYGIDKENYIYQMARIISKAHFSISIGNGRNFFQPILVDDLSRIVIECMKNFKLGAAYDISGNDTLSINLVITKIENILQAKQRRIRIPVLLLRPIKHFLKFDLDGFMEDRFAKEIYKYSYTPFDECLPKIINLALKKV